MSPSPTDPPTAAPTSSPAPRVRTSVRDWVCPFCPLLCDDLVVDVRDDASLEAKDSLCSRLDAALASYGAHDAECASTVDGQPVSTDIALAHAAQLLSSAARPLIGGLATDIAGSRALYTLAAGCGAILDHLNGDALSAATLALQDRGAVFTTLAEVRSRADLLVVFGCRPSLRYPRFFERTLADEGFARELVFVGCDVDSGVAQFPHLRAEALLADADPLDPLDPLDPFDPFDPFDTLAAWSAASAGHARVASASRTPTALSALSALSALQTRIAAARYTVFVYEPAALPAPHAALLIEALNRIVKAANRTSRAACLALGGDDGALSAQQAVTWLSGLPLRTRVATPARAPGSAPLDHDPYRYRTERLVAAREVDALLWVASFGPQPWPASLDDATPLIVLGHPALADAAVARGANTVFVPVATPGIDSGGHLFRVDGTVVLPLAAARGAPLPTVARIASSLSARLVNQFATPADEPPFGTGTTSPDAAPFGRNDAQNEARP